LSHIPTNISVNISKNVALDDLNTFAVKAKADAFIQIDSVRQLESVFDEISGYKERLVLGGGSNLLFIGDYSGLVIYPQLKGIEIITQDDEQVTLRVAASENWHEFVGYCLQHDYFGLENLALIPGTVGAAPVQNIGAYGVEVGSFIVQIECFDLQQGKQIILTHAECEFDYRDSFVKRAGQGRYLVISVEFKLNKKPNLVLTYQPLKDFFAGVGFEQITAKQIFDRVCEIRAEKLPDPKQIANAGSFFKNPIIDQAHYQRLQKIFPELVVYPLNSKPSGKMNYKVAAGWLVEKAGFKGKVVGKVGVHKHQALVLVNYSDYDGANILALARLIINEVKVLFGIELVPEVRILGNEKELSVRSLK